MSEIPFKAPSLDSLAELLPTFEFERLIAQGGMGAVYKAKHRLLERNVAIKILPREMGDDPLFRASFEAEAKVMAKVTHPNLVTIYESGDVDGLLYIAMEYVDGKSLFDATHQQAIQPTQAVDWVLGICRGLAEAHKNGIVHRDIKPANILLTKSHKAKIGDFGLACTAGHEAGGLAMGTPGYAAPEVSHHPELADRRSDIFSVGVILQELLSGISPENGTPSDTSIADPDLREICRTACQSDPSLRYQSTASMMSALDMWRTGTRASPSEASTRSSRRKRSPHRTLIRTVAIIALLLAALLTLWNTRETPEPNTLVGEPANLPTPTSGPAPIPPPPEPPAPVIHPAAPEPAAPQPPAPPAPVVEKPSDETPAQSLLRLRSALAAGNFSQLPIGTLTRDEHHYFYVSRSTSWESASRMARAYGGHLPIFSDPVEKQWLAQAMPPMPDDDPSKRIAWIGASRTSPDLWQWESALPWNLGSPPAGSGDFAAMDRNGMIESLPATANHPFFIQWHRNGSNPTQLRQILAECAQSQETDQPFYPPGIVTFGARRFLIVEEARTYPEAFDLAEVGGGKLMSAATMEEAAWLEAQIQDLAAPNGLWLGASRRKNLWRWDDRQPWNFARWATNSEPDEGDTLLILPKQGWIAAERNTQGSGLVIEWSAEPAPEKPDRDPTADLEAFEQRASELLGEFDIIRNQANAKNTKDYIWQLDIWLRQRRNSAEIAEWTPRIRKVKSEIRQGRLPDKIPRKSNATYPTPILKIAKFHADKQSAQDRRFLAHALTIRDSYIARLTEEATKARSIGQRESAMIIEEKIKAADDIRAWVASFGFRAE